jgi:hypothetical protein
MTTSEEIRWENEQERLKYAPELSDSMNEVSSTIISNTPTNRRL